eukprot:SAG31_NODE_330_length_17593_cov_4.817891_13_plen_243_part_00
MSVRELKARLDAVDVDYSSALDKNELVRLVTDSMPGADSAENPLNHSDSEYYQQYGNDGARHQPPNSSSAANNEPYTRKYSDPPPPVLAFAMKWGKFGREYKWFLLVFVLAMVLCRLMCHFHVHFHYLWCFIVGWGMTATFSIIGTYKQVGIGNSPTLMGGFVIGNMTRQCLVQQRIAQLLLRSIMAGFAIGLLCAGAAMCSTWWGASICYFVAALFLFRVYTLIIDVDEKEVINDPYWCAY